MPPKEKLKAAVGGTKGKPEKVKTDSSTPKGDQTERTDSIPKDPETGLKMEGNLPQTNDAKSKNKKDKVDKKAKKKGAKDKEKEPPPPPPPVLDATEDSSPLTGGTDKQKRKKQLKAPPNTQKTPSASSAGEAKEAPATNRVSANVETRTRQMSSGDSQMCSELVQEFWNTSWGICAERFLQKAAPVIVGLELRDTWLRIVEAEWLDQDQPRTDMPADIFKADNPPLPLALDTWSRGALELMPSTRRQSILDPYLLDLGGSGDGLALGESSYDMTPEGRRRRRKQLRKNRKGKQAKGRSRSDSQKGKKGKKTKSVSTGRRTKSRSPKAKDEAGDKKSRSMSPPASKRKPSKERKPFGKSAERKPETSAKSRSVSKERPSRSRKPKSSERVKKSKKKAGKSRSPSKSGERKKSRKSKSKSPASSERSKKPKSRSKKRSKKSKSKTRSPSAGSSVESKKSSKGRSRSRKKKGERKSKKERKRSKKRKDRSALPPPSVLQLPTPPNSMVSLKPVSPYEMCGEDQELLGEYLEDSDLQAMGFLPTIPYTCVEKGTMAQQMKPGLPLETLYAPRNMDWTDEDESQTELEMCVPDPDGGSWGSSVASLRYSGMTGKMSDVDVQTMQNLVLTDASETETDTEANDDRGDCSATEFEGEDGDHYHQGTNTKCRPKSPTGGTRSMQTLMGPKTHFSTMAPAPRDDEAEPEPGVIQPVKISGPKTSVRDMKDEIIAKQREALRNRATQSLPSLK